MRLTVYSDLSLRVLMYVGLHPDGRPTIAEVAASYGVSKNHLMKVVYQLGVAGYVTTSRGKHGGLRLARAAAEIGLGELVRRTEPDLALAPCFGPESAAACPIAPVCKLRRALWEARSAFLDVLDGYTLADLVENRAPLQELLTIHRASSALAPPVLGPGS